MWGAVGVVLTLPWPRTDPGRAFTSHSAEPAIDLFTRADDCLHLLIFDLQLEVFKALRQKRIKSAAKVPLAVVNR